MITPLIPSFGTQIVHQVKNFNSFFHKQGPPLRHLGYVYAVLSKALLPISFGLKILLAMLQMTRSLKILHFHGPKLEIF